TRWSDDEAAAEDLRRLSLRGRSGRFRGHPVVALDRQKARLGYAGNTHRQPTQPDRGPARRLIWPAKPGQLPKIKMRIADGPRPRFGRAPGKPALNFCPSRTDSMVWAPVRARGRGAGIWRQLLGYSAERASSFLVPRTVSVPFYCVRWISVL